MKIRNDGGGWIMRVEMSALMEQLFLSDGLHVSTLSQMPIPSI